jgi:hypothetical protein
LNHLGKLWQETARLSDEESADLLFRQPLLTIDQAGRFKRLIKQKFLIAQGKDLFFEPLIR